MMNLWTLMVFTLGLINGQQADGIISGSVQYDFNNDGVTDGRDIQPLVNEWLYVEGIYTHQQLDNVRKHPRRAEFEVNRKEALSRARPAITVLEKIGYCQYEAEYSWLTGDTQFHHLRASNRVTSLNVDLNGDGLINDSDRHIKVFQLLNLCRIASLSDECYDEIFDDALKGCKDGTFWGTNLGMDTWVRCWIDATRGKRSGLDDLGKSWGFRHIYAVGLGQSLFKFDGTDLWYWAFNSRPALVAVGLVNRPIMTSLDWTKYQIVYRMPIETLAEGRTPVIGTQSAKAYAFWGGWSWTWWQADNDSYWAREQTADIFDNLTFENLTVLPEENIAPYEEVNRNLDDRLLFTKVPDGTLVTHYGDGVQINGAKRTPGPFPRRQLITQEKIIYVPN